MLNVIIAQVVFGWPFVVLSLAISIIGITGNRAWIVLVGAVLILPFCYNLNATSMFRGVGLFLPLFHIGSAVAVHEESDLWAWLLLVPTTFLSTWLFVISIIS